MRALWTRSTGILSWGLLVLAASHAALAAPPWASLIPFKKVEADPQASYELTEQHGPWLIMCTSFAGPTAEQQAHDLVL
jgi:invasion protein IalB